MNEQVEIKSEDENKENGVYSACMTLDHADSIGAWFGRLYIKGVTQRGNKPCPGLIVIPTQIWESNGKPESMTVGFRFGEFNHIEIVNKEQNDG